ncbi:tRNA (adenosine(37)-N6)-threonylcarbamoyltransferase complex ATPase subunit type 1 TsaE [bacterium]|nr:tRNA (adenosine(37)-N6)-threonylcarbamoyltransferase complex ATPase subunit type 1 TsaE [bacterium]
MKETSIHESASVAETELIGAELARQLRSGDVVALYGELGAGKTCLIRGLAHQLGVAEAVTSPTFTLINEYQASLPLYHFDLYRLEHPGELEDIGYEDYFYSEGICVVEWPERAGTLLPQAHWKVQLTIASEDKRRISIQIPLGRSTA